MSSSDELPDHHFETTPHVIKAAAHKGKEKTLVSLVIPPYRFKKKLVKPNGTIYFTCNGCYSAIPPKHLSARAILNDQTHYALIFSPHEEQPICCPSSTENIVKKQLNHSRVGNRADSSNIIEEASISGRSRHTKRHTKK